MYCLLVRSSDREHFYETIRCWAKHKKVTFQNFQIQVWIFMVGGQFQVFSTKNTHLSRSEDTALLKHLPLQGSLILTPGEIFQVVMIFFTLVETMWEDLDTKHSYSQLWPLYSHTTLWEAWWKMDLERRLSGLQYLLFFWASTWGLTTICNNSSWDLTSSYSLCGHQNIHGSFTCMQANTHMHKIKNSKTCLHILKGPQFKLKPPLEQCFD